MQHSFHKETHLFFNLEKCHAFVIPTATQCGIISAGLWSLLVLSTNKSALLLTLEENVIIFYCCRFLGLSKGQNVFFCHGEKMNLKPAVCFIWHTSRRGGRRCKPPFYQSIQGVCVRQARLLLTAVGCMWRGVEVRSGYISLRSSPTLRAEKWNWKCALLYM